MNWTEKKHKEQMQSAVDRLVAYFKSKGILFIDSDGELANVKFTDGKTEVILSQHSFYGYSRIANIYRPKGENLMEKIPVTDDMYVNEFMKNIIEARFKKSS